MIYAGFAIVIALEVLMLVRLERLHRIIGAHGRRLVLIRQAITELKPAEP